jgi:hypothetical protein
MVRPWISPPNNSVAGEERRIFGCAAMLAPVFIPSRTCLTTARMACWRFYERSRPTAGGGRGGRGGWRLAVGGWRLAVGGGRWAVGGGRWAVGGGRLAVGGWRSAVGGGRWAVGGGRLAECGTKRFVLCVRRRKFIRNPQSAIRNPKSKCRRLGAPTEHCIPARSATPGFGPLEKSALKERRIGGCSHVW